MAGQQVTREEVERTRSLLTNVVDNVETVIRGKREAVELVVLALIAKGHVLLEDLPGTGKTTLVSTLARSIACDFNRIQFTPDIMPSDVSGFSIFNQKTREFEFRPGGVMSNLVLADEINRASAKTQSALLEAMEERQVTVDSNTYRLPEPFMVLATQNPIEQFGTYPLPEAQLDRFLVKLSMGYPAFNQEVEVLSLGDSNKKALRSVVTTHDILAARDVAARVLAVDIVMRYIVEIVTATRNHPEVQVGSSPRGGLALLALSRAYALMQGRGYVVPDDVKLLAPYVLNHRIALAHDAKVAGRTPQDVIASIIAGISVPIVDEGARTREAPSAEGSPSIGQQVQGLAQPALQAQGFAQSAPQQQTAQVGQQFAPQIAQPAAQQAAQQFAQSVAQPAGAQSAVQVAQPVERVVLPSEQAVQSMGQQPAQAAQWSEQPAQVPVHLVTSAVHATQQASGEALSVQASQWPAQVAQEPAQVAQYGQSESAQQHVAGAYPADALRQQEEEPQRTVVRLEDYAGSDKNIRLF